MKEPTKEQEAKKKELDELEDKLRLTDMQVLGCIQGLNKYVKDAFDILGIVGDALKDHKEALDDLHTQVKGLTNYVTKKEEPHPSKKKKVYKTYD